LVTDLGGGVGADIIGSGLRFGRGGGVGARRVGVGVGRVGSELLIIVFNSTGDGSTVVVFLIGTAASVGWFASISTIFISPALTCSFF